MNRIGNPELHRVISRHYKLNESDPIQTVSSEAVPVILVEDFKHPHQNDTEVNRGVYDGLIATVAAGDIACTFELFNPLGSGVVAEVCSVQGGASYATDVSLHLCTAVNPHGGGNGLGKWLHMGTQGSVLPGNSALTDGFDLNRQAVTNFGGGFISISRIAANQMAELMAGQGGNNCPIFVIPGTGIRVQVKGLTAGTAYWRAAWVERRQPQIP